MIVKLKEPGREPKRNTAYYETTSMLCPLCNVALKMSARQGIEIDYCPKCRGVWLDRGELDKILERSVSETSPSKRSSQSQYHRHDKDDDDDDYDDDDDRDHDKRRHKRYRRKSWLHELFD